MPQGRYYTVDSHWIDLDDNIAAIPLYHKIVQVVGNSVMFKIIIDSLGGQDFG